MLFKSRWLLGFLIGSILAGSAAVVLAGGINVRSPEDVTSEDFETLTIPPPLFPPNQTGYGEHPVDQPVVAPDGRPVAQFATAADLANRLDVFLPDNSPENADDIAYGVLSSIKYSGQDQFVLVTTVRPTTAAAGQPQVLGEKTVTLSNGQTAWATDETGFIIMDAEAPLEIKNQITWVQDDLLITVGSNLPLEEVQKLAAKVVVK